MLTGDSGSESFFKFEETNGLNFEALLRVLRGELAGVVARQCFPLDIGSKIAEKFWASPKLRQRSSGGTAHYLGAYAYQKQLESYFREVDHFRNDVADALLFPNSPYSTFVASMSNFLENKGITFRLAEYEGQQASEGVIRCYTTEGRFVLRPHDDEAMFSWPAQRGFEIQKVTGYAVCGLNMCLENGSGGYLYYWNVRPDAASREYYGTTHTGDFYPVEALGAVDMLKVAVNPGDIYAFNGAFVHAVGGYNGLLDRRTTISCFMGFRDKNTLIRWA